MIDMERPVNPGIVSHRKMGIANGTTRFIIDTTN